MPFTPLHLGPGLLLGILSLRFFNLWAILLGSVIMDLESFTLAIIKCGGLLETEGCPNHGFFHSILGAIFGSLILAAILWKFREKLNKISLKFRISQPFSFKILFSSSLVAWLIHIFFDSLTHFDVSLFWPSRYNPFFIGPELYLPLNFLFLILGIFGLLLLYKKIKTPKNL